ncbi:MAG: ATPase, partial [Chromatiaceae bacterium]|nr:ATPase [Chromatiaceae bacterium]MBP6261131.1 ATPase [Chromatiaceae bacterium]MBP7983540.1 ATPase [Chromatiaceae bacterium]
EEEAERLVQAAVAEAKAQEERFRARIPDLHKGYIQKSQERAEQTVAELKRRYDERHVQLRNMAEEREEDALVAAFDLLLAAD